MNFDECCRTTICILRFFRIRPVQSVVNSPTQLSGRGFPRIFHMKLVLSQHHVFWYSKMEAGPCNLKMCNSEFWIFEVLTFINLSLWNFEFWNFKISKVRNLKCWNFEISNFDILNFWNFEILKFWNLKFWKFQIWNFENLKFEILNV